MTSVPAKTGDFELTLDELRVVAQFSVESAQAVLPIFERADQADSRPREAVQAAWAFVNGAARTNLQRTSALAAFRAAREVTGASAQHAARAAGAAAAAAYLHPLARATQVGHVLGAAASAARAAELDSSDHLDVGTRFIERACQRATPGLIDVLRRYPPAPTGSNRVAQLMTMLDNALRSTR